MKKLPKNQIVGWIAVALSTVIACIWAFWGIIENFHEGWFHESFLMNIGLLLIQYLSPMFIFVFLCLLGLTYPRIGGVVHALIGIVLASVLFDWEDAVAMQLIIIPMVLLGILYWLGRPQPLRIAYGIAVGLPLLTLIICGIEPIWRVAGRINDGNLGERLIEGNGVRLVWAAEGNGWTREGVNWQEAVKRCQNLAEDGQTLKDVPQNVWRLPTVDEAVRSMSRHEVNSGGTWDEQTKTAKYNVRPDKESPLWNVYSQVIYWWTANEIDENNAYIIVYDGKVWSRNKRFGPASLGYRCVKPIK